MVSNISTPCLKKTNYKKYEQNPSFRGLEKHFLSSLSWMKNNPAMGACAVDMCAMVLPRSFVELKERGKQSGIETFIREFSSLLIHLCMGYIGYGAASIISGDFYKKYNIKAQEIFASGDTIQNMSELWKNANGNIEGFFKNFTGNIKGLNTVNWNSIQKENQETITKKLVELSLQKENSNLKNEIISLIVKDTGAKTSYKLKGLNGAKEISAGLSELIDNAVSLSRAFKNVTKEKFPQFIKDLKNNKSKSTLLGLAITSILCISVQPINRMLTKKRTGNDGFVGVDSKENDNSPEFKALKTITGIGFPIFAISTIGCKFKDLLSHIQFNSKIPSINQFKFIYGFTISSRLLASRDVNELRETLLKDMLGFSTWLLFGDFVAKSASRLLGGNDLINNPIKKDGKPIPVYAKDWLMNTSVKSFEELLLPQAQTIKKDNKLINLMTIYEKAADNLKTKVRKAALAQTLGYLFSGFVLGSGITKFNIFMTKHFYSKEKAYNQMNKTINSASLQQKTNTSYLSGQAKKNSPVFKNFV